MFVRVRSVFTIRRIELIYVCTLSFLFDDYKTLSIISKQVLLSGTPFAAGVLLPCSESFVVQFPS
jgi:hypothetical protein